jgi:hypothetical protein
VIYFCIPAHNEERTVGVVLWKLRQVMGELNRDYQIIVVDDASDDSTPAVLSPYIRVLPLTVIRNSQRRGYADSLEVALREAVRRAPYPKRDAVIVLQGDFTEDPDVVPTLVKRIEAGADLVVTETAIEHDVPRSFRWARRLFRWMVRGKEWAQGDPLSGLRAYRIVTMKRAIDARGASRLLSWNGWGANVELLALTVPHSRRTDVVETTLKHHRHQRDSRFSFMSTLALVRGAAAGRLNAAARALPTDGVVATPLPIVTEPVQRGREQHQQRGRDRGKTGQQRGGRQQQRPVRERPRVPENPRKPRPAKPAAPVVAVAPETVAGEATETAKKKRRRRPRRRKEKRTQENAPQLALEQTESVVEVSSSTEEAQPDAAAPRKKSRRGRRGGRGRRRGPRASNENNTATQGESGGDSPPPPMAAEGD